MPTPISTEKFVPGSAYGPRNARAHQSAMRVIKKMTASEFLASLEAAELGPVLEVERRRAATKKKARSTAAKRLAKKISVKKPPKRR